MIMGHSIILLYLMFFFTAEIYAQVEGGGNSPLPPNGPEDSVVSIKTDVASSLKAFDENVNMFSDAIGRIVKDTVEEEAGELDTGKKSTVIADLEAKTAKERSDAIGALQKKSFMLRKALAKYFTDLKMFKSEVPVSGTDGERATAEINFYRAHGYDSGLLSIRVRNLAFGMEELADFFKDRVWSIKAGVLSSLKNIPKQKLKAPQNSIPNVIRELKRRIMEINKEIMKFNFATRKSVVGIKESDGNADIDIKLPTDLKGRLVAEDEIDSLAILEFELKSAESSLAYWESQHNIISGSSVVGDATDTKDLLEKAEIQLRAISRAERWKSHAKGMLKAQPGNALVFFMSALVTDTAYQLAGMGWYYLTRDKEEKALKNGINSDPYSVYSFVKEQKNKYTSSVESYATGVSSYAAGFALAAPVSTWAVGKLFERLTRFNGFYRLAFLRGFAANSIGMGIGMYVAGNTALYMSIKDMLNSNDPEVRKKAEELQNYNLWGGQSLEKLLYSIASFAGAEYLLKVREINKCKGSKDEAATSFRERLKRNTLRKQFVHMTKIMIIARPIEAALTFAAFTLPGREQRSQQLLMELLSAIEKDMEKSIDSAQQVDEVFIESFKGSYKAFSYAESTLELIEENLKSEDSCFKRFIVSDSDGRKKCIKALIQGGAMDSPEFLAVYAESIKEPEERARIRQIMVNKYKKRVEFLRGKHEKVKDGENLVSLSIGMTELSMRQVYISLIKDYAKTGEYAKLQDALENSYNPALYRNEKFFNTAKNIIAGMQDSSCENLKKMYKETSKGIILASNRAATPGTDENDVFSYEFDIYKAVSEALWDRIYSDTEKYCSH